MTLQAVWQALVAMEEGSRIRKVPWFWVFRSRCLLTSTPFTAATLQRVHQLQQPSLVRPHTRCRRWCKQLLMWCTRARYLHAHNQPSGWVLGNPRHIQNDDVRCIEQVEALIAAYRRRCGVHLAASASEGAPNSVWQGPVVRMTRDTFKKLRPVELLVLAGLLRDGDPVLYRRRSGPVQAHGTIKCVCLREGKRFFCFPAHHTHRAQQGDGYTLPQLWPGGRLHRV